MDDFFKVELLLSSVGSDGEKKNRLPEELQEKLPALKQTIIDLIYPNSRHKTIFLKNTYNITIFLAERCIVTVF
jgi:hypothetical protein